MRSVGRKGYEMTFREGFLINRVRDWGLSGKDHGEKADDTGISASWRSEKTTKETVLGWK